VQDGEVNNTYINHYKVYREQCIKWGKIFTYNLRMFVLATYNTASINNKRGLNTICMDDEAAPVFTGLLPPEVLVARFPDVD